VYCVWQVVKTPTFISNNPVFSVIRKCLLCFSSMNWNLVKSVHSGGKPPAVRRGEAGQSMWDLWWTNSQRYRFLPQYFTSSLSITLFHYSTVIHPSSTPHDISYRRWSFNTLLSAHAEMRDCSSMRCWRAPHFCVFLHDVQHAHFRAGLTRWSLQGYHQLHAGCLDLKLQADRLLLNPILER